MTSPPDNEELLDAFKQYTQQRFDVKLYANMTGLTGWSIVHSAQRITIRQEQYTSLLLRG